MVSFVVDSNFFIEAHRTTYPLDVAIGFWSKVRLLAQTGIIISIDKVRSEIFDKNDSLKCWCQENLPDDFFKNTNEILDEYSHVTSWAISMNYHYLPKALNEFLSGDEADAFLVAYALADPTQRILVTQEIRAPQKRNKIKIPDCCVALGVTTINTIELFRRIGETF